MSLSVLAYARYFLYNKIFPKVNSAYFNFKHWGYPKFIAPKVFKESGKQIVSEKEKEIKVEVREKIP